DAADVFLLQHAVCSVSRALPFHGDYPLCPAIHQRYRYMAKSVIQPFSAFYLADGDSDASVRPARCLSHLARYPRRIDVLLTDSSGISGRQTLTTPKNVTL